MTDNEEILPAISSLQHQADERFTHGENQIKVRIKAIDDRFLRSNFMQYHQTKLQFFLEELK